MRYIKLSEYAKAHNLSYQTAWNHFKAGKIGNTKQLESGTILVGVSDIAKKTVIYSRVSSSQNRGNLTNQTERLKMFCNANGWIVDSVVEECASGLNDERPKLLKILRDPSVGRIVVEHKDRLTRFGFGYIEALFGGEIVVVNKTTEREPEREPELVEDLVSIITSFCARIYGSRRTKRKTEKIIEELNRD